MMKCRALLRWLPMLALAGCSSGEQPASPAQIARVELNTGYTVTSSHAVRTDHEAEAYYVTATIARPDVGRDTAVTFLMMGPKDAPSFVLRASPHDAKR